MGNLVGVFSSPKELKLLLLGLDAAGKTTILYKMKRRGEPVENTIPTIGFNVETLTTRTRFGVVWTAWDVGGRSKIRPLLRHYYPETDAMVFVVDSNDSDRLPYARDELWRILNEEELSKCPLLLLCNKQDLPKALPPDEISERLGLSSLSTDRPIRAIGCIAVENTEHTGRVLQEGLDWLNKAVQVEESSKPSDAQSAKTTPAASSRADLATLFGYDPTKAGGNSTLARFQKIKHSSECPFARSAKLWGGNPAGGSLEEQAKGNAQSLTEFVNRSNAGAKLDGFCIELEHRAAREGGPEQLGACVCRVLQSLSGVDPAGEALVQANCIGSRGWRFRFNKADFFVTTFAPCYPASSSRYAHGCRRAFLLLQPEASFLRHDLPFDTPDTNWEAPKTVRDKTRVAFRKRDEATIFPKRPSTLQLIIS